MDFLKNFREKNGYTISSMANKLEISKSLYEKIEYGIRHPSQNFLHRFKQAFPDFDMNNFFNDSAFTLKTNSKQIK